MSKKESVLNDAERESFEIEKFIFHIILKDELIPIYLDEVVLDAPQKQFFKDRFKEISEGVQYIFPKDKNGDRIETEFIKDCEKLINKPDKWFLEISKKLTESFKKQHTNNTNDGVFITSIVTVEESRRLIFLLKIDHKKVYEYKVDKKKKALLTEITQTFIEDKKAIQKSALIDISDYYIWDVLATDRNGNTQKPITDYFKLFMDVVARETASTLTPKVIKAVQKWAIANQGSENMSFDVSTYKNNVIKYLYGVDRFSTKACIDKILEDEDEGNAKILRPGLKSFFDELGLSGQSFKPNTASIKEKSKQHIRRTAEGVIIKWQGDAKEQNVTIPTEPDQNTGLYNIVISTSHIGIEDQEL